MMNLKQTPIVVICMVLMTIQSVSAKNDSMPAQNATLWPKNDSMPTQTASVSEHTTSASLTTTTTSLLKPATTISEQTTSRFSLICSREKPCPRQKVCLWKHCYDCSHCAGSPVNQ